MTSVLIPRNLHILLALCAIPIFFLLVGIFKLFSFIFFLILVSCYFQLFVHLIYHISVSISCLFYSVVTLLDVCILVHFSYLSRPGYILKFWLNNSQTIYLYLLLSQFLILHIRVNSGLFVSFHKTKMTIHDVLQLMHHKNNVSYYFAYIIKIK